ncbi:lytic murein transglycosylase [Fuscibacter oryzae]|uniref:Lytic murein transglycosylase n=1 Tax=Fuscibacter oryzae TaxID=2803939 RepID=A0A8J7MP71_9RHOB|nr:lytic murein transglycosylase [Fuscibacter oryzae]MBL4928530.1 lytic murein transglycosylase [Fuscibacter oryzae]
MITRRGAVLGMVSLAGLSACVGGGGSVPRVPSQVFRPEPNAAFDAWVDGFRARAAGRGISGGVIDAAFRHVGFLPGVIERDRNQTEFTRTTEDYLSIAASDERVALGRQMVSRFGGELAAIEGRYGVDRYIVAAVWGLESFFGTRRGDVPVISALSTLAFEGRRGEFFEGQLIAALKILQSGDTTPDRMTGSWAGAMGHTQFIPTSYLAYAVDFDGDWRRDIWSDDPGDALASTAAYLSRSGWQRGQPWGMEVRLPAGFDTALAGRGKGRATAEWAAMGVTAAEGGGLPGGVGSVLAPAGAGGPAFLIFQNFNVILRYNNAENYALGVGHLSDRLRGQGPLRGSFPPDATGLTKADRQEIQTRLAGMGYDVGTPDGVIGTKTKDAISAFQKSRGLAVTGVPSPDLLAALRRG